MLSPFVLLKHPEHQSSKVELLLPVIPIGIVEFCKKTFVETADTPCKTSIGLFLPREYGFEPLQSDETVKINPGYVFKGTTTRSSRAR